MEFFTPIGDALASLQVDKDGKKPSNMEAFFNIMDKLGKTKNDEKKEGFAEESPSKLKGLLTVAKPAAVITAVAMILMAPQVQEMFTKMFAKAHIRYGVIALLLLVVSMVAIKKL